MACFALSTSNFGAMALDPVAKVAGIGACLQSFASTLGGSRVPLTTGCLCGGLASRLFVPPAREE
jgi:hypothetical protein